MTSTTAAAPLTAGEPVEAVVGRLRRAVASGRTRSRAWRSRQLAAIVTLLDEQEDAIARAIASDLGRSAHDSWLGEIAGTRSEATYARRRLRRWMRPRRVGLSLSMLPGSAHVRFEPRGVVLVIGPWNYPFYLTLGPLIGALSAGNAVVVKPSEHAPASSALLAELLPRYLDADAVAVVEGEADTTQHLLDQGLDLAFFTGGPEIGKKVMEGAARHLTPVVLELGGKSPAIVLADADLDVAARRIAWVKLLNSGQTCIAPDYVLVEASVRDALVTRLRATIETFRDGERAGQRLVNERQYDRVASMAATAGGSTVLGGTGDRSTLAFEPTIVVDPDPGSELMASEIFGPILPVVTVGSLDEAVATVNRGSKPLAAYLFSRSRRAAQRVLDEISSGGAVINHVAMHCLVPQLPFGGVGTSGMGSYHGRWGFETFSHRKSVLTKSTAVDPSLMYPPYSDRDKALMRRVL